MDTQQKQVLSQFFISKFTEDQANFHLWLVEFALKSKAQQKAEVVAWLDAKKTTNTAAFNGVDTQAQAWKDNLTAENSNIDAIKTLL